MTTHGWDIGLARHPAHRIPESLAEDVLALVSPALDVRAIESITLNRLSASGSLRGTLLEVAPFDRCSAQRVEMTGELVGRPGCALFRRLPDQVQGEPVD